MTPADLKSIRRQLGLTQSGLARCVSTTDRTVRKWENGERGIPGPVQVLVQLMRDVPVVREMLPLPLPRVSLLPASE